MWSCWLDIHQYRYSEYKATAQAPHSPGASWCPPPLLLSEQWGVEGASCCRTTWIHHPPTLEPPGDTTQSFDYNATYYHLTRWSEVPYIFTMPLYLTRVTNHHQQGGFTWKSDLRSLVPKGSYQGKIPPKPSCRSIYKASVISGAYSISPCIQPFKVTMPSVMRDSYHSCIFLNLISHRISVVKAFLNWPPLQKKLQTSNFKVSIFSDPSITNWFTHHHKKKEAKTELSIYETLNKSFFFLFLGFLFDEEECVDPKWFFENTFTYIFHIRFESTEKSSKCQGELIFSNKQTNKDITGPTTHDCCQTDLFKNICLQMC